MQSGGRGKTEHDKQARLLDAAGHREIIMSCGALSLFIFLCAGYSTHKRFVLGGEECAVPFAGKTFVSCKTLVAYYADGCSPVDKGQVGYGL
jgi:hypothetical protein